MERFLFIPWIVALLSVVALIYFIRRCRFWRYRPANLVIDDECIVAWMTLNNTFSKITEGGVKKDRPYWTGALFQLGQYVGEHAKGDMVFSELRLHSSDASVETATLKNGEFTWLNIVSVAPPSRGQPLAPDDALCLYPNTAACSTACDPIWQCFEDPACTPKWYPDRGDASPWNNAQNLNGACFRGRNIHNRFDVNAIMTYWQGALGYEMRVNQESGRANLHNRYRLHLRDSFRVEAYDETVIDGQPTLVMKPGYPIDSIRLIEVLGKDSGVGGGDHQDPAWHEGGGG